MVTPADKQRCRTHYRKERAAFTENPERLRRLDAQLRDHLRELLCSFAPSAIAAYAPLPGEPGGPELVEFLSSLVPTVWLPISHPGGILEWTIYQGRKSMRPGRFGISEPTGDRHPTSCLFDCPIILIPALACSPAGLRMGQGSGYYDRTLAELRSHPTPPRIVALLHPWEIRDDVPAEPHDERVDLILTAEGPRYPQR